MDVYLCEIDGLMLLKQIRQTENIPFIAISSKGNLKEKACFISNGADDYLPKPQEQDELEDCLLRTQSLIRRYSEQAHVEQPTYTIVSCSGLMMNAELRAAYFRGKPMKLTRKEFDMLQLLAGNPGRVFTYEQIFGQVWDESYMGSVNTISKHISRLRKKEPELSIESVHDIGYRLNKKEEY